MIDRLTNALAWVSLGFTMVVFLISYANFPEDVLIYISSNGAPLQYIARNPFFYMLLSVIIVFNGGWLALRSIVNQKKNYETSAIGVSFVQIFFNVFVATAIYFVKLLNSRENLDYSNFGLFVYITAGLLLSALIFVLIARFILKK